MAKICTECHLEWSDHMIYEDGLCPPCHFGDNIGLACDYGECVVFGCRNNPNTGLTDFMGKVMKTPDKKWFELKKEDE